VFILRRPPRPPLFPYTTLFRSLQLHPTSVTNIVDRLEADGLVKRVPHPSDRRATLVEITEPGRQRLQAATEAVTSIDFGLKGLRSEEHTSELQSRENLVCRLLL